MMMMTVMIMVIPMMVVIKIVMMMMIIMIIMIIMVIMMTMEAMMIELLMNSAGCEVSSLHLLAWYQCGFYLKGQCLPFTNWWFSFSPRICKFFSFVFISVQDCSTFCPKHLAFVEITCC